MNFNGNLSEFFYTVDGKDIIIKGIKDKGATEVTLPDGVTKIAEEAFKNCGLSRVGMGKDLTFIADLAFENCKNLSRIDYSGTVREWNGIEKGFLWDYETGDYTIYCIDGKIGIDGTVSRL